MCCVHWNYYTMKFYHYKLYDISHVAFNCLGMAVLVSPCKSYIQNVVLTVCCELSLVHMPALFWVTFVIILAMSLYNSV